MAIEFLKVAAIRQEAKERAIGYEIFQMAHECSEPRSKIRDFVEFVHDEDWSEPGSIHSAHQHRQEPIQVGQRLILR